jgi:hypothetical protein
MHSKARNLGRLLPPPNSAVRATLLCGGNARSSPAFLRITCGLPTARDRSGGRDCVELFVRWTTRIFA